MSDKGQSRRQAPGFTLPGLARALNLPESTVRRAVARGEIKTVPFAGRDRITPTEAERVRVLWRQAAIAVLDGTWHAELAAPHFTGRMTPRPAVVIDAALPADACVVSQIYDEAVSHGHLKGIIQTPDKVAEYGFWILGRYAAAGGAASGGIKAGGPAGAPSGLVITTMAFEEALWDWFDQHGGLPAGLEMAHFYNLRGIDRWRHVGWLGVIGRPLPPAAAIWEIRAVLARRPATQHGADYDFADALYLNGNVSGLGSVRAKTVPVLPDALANVILASRSLDELKQAIARVRLLRRGGERVAVDLLTNCPTGLPVHRFLRLNHALRDANDLGVICAAKGIVPARLTMTAEDYEARFLGSGQGYQAIVACLTGQTASAVKNDLWRLDRPPPFQEILEKGAWIEADVQLAPGKKLVPCRIHAENQKAAEELVHDRLGVTGKGCLQGVIMLNGLTLHIRGLLCRVRPLSNVTCPGSASDALPQGAPSMFSARGATDGFFDTFPALYEAAQDCG